MATDKADLKGIYQKFKFENVLAEIKYIEDQEQSLDNHLPKITE